MKIKSKCMSAAQGIVEVMKQEKVDYVFAVPGESYLPLLDALYDTKEIKLISTRHEGGAAFMAEGYAKASGRPGVVMATRGVGAANLTIGVHTAYQDSTPMVVFLGQVRSDFRGREGFQEVDFEQFFAPISKWIVEINDPKRVPELMTQAFYRARSGRPGPVVVSLPEDILPLEAEMTFPSYVPSARPGLGQKEKKLIEKSLQEAERPLLIAGGGVKLAKAEEALEAFAEKYSIPLMASFRRHDVFPNDHPLYVGHLGMGTNKEILAMVKEADLLLAIGTRLSEVTSQDYSLIENHHELIHIDISIDSLHKVYAPHLGIVSDAKEALRSLMDLEVQISWQDWARGNKKLYSRISSLPEEKDRIINEHIIAILQDKLPSHTIITNDAGNFATWLHAYYSFREKNTYLGPTSGAMGYALPAALGAKLVDPERKVLALAGDGGFMMTIQELETAVRYKIPVIVLVFNNRMYGTIRMHQEMHYPKRVLGTDLGDLSFRDLAESFGAVGFKVETREEFSRALQAALLNEKLTVIEVITDQEHVAPQQTITNIRKKYKGEDSFDQGIT